MKRALLAVLMIAFLVLGVSACSKRLATHTGPTADAPKTDIAVPTGGATKPADAPTTVGGTAAAANVLPADALKLILLQLLVAR